MFYLPKIVWGLIEPSTFIAVLLAAAAVFTILGKTRRALSLFIAGSVLYAVIGFSPLAVWTMASLEVRASAMAAKDLDGAAGIVVLGGGIDKQSALAASPHLNDAADRMTETVRLAARYPSLPVIFSGGSGQFFAGENQETEAELARRFFENFGIVPPRLKLEDRSRNTAENAMLTAKLLNPQPGQKWILVTSAFHMQRAKALFEAQGFEVLPWPADFRTDGFSGRWQFFSRASAGLTTMDLAAKEWVGLAAACLTGNIHCR
jgi:uncharacterized SAM-binding protein YcdF (DUF218 family)